MGPGSSERGRKHTIVVCPGLDGGQPAALGWVLYRGGSEMARRIQCSRHGGSEVLEYADFTPAEPGPQEVRVLNRAIGLNFIDTYYRSGLYQPPALPAGLGTEAAGEVEEV